MPVLQCPECHHPVADFVVYTEAQRNKANEAMAHHLAECHLMSGIEQMLEITAVMTGIDRLLECTKPLCAGCCQHVTVDNGLYYKTRYRTQLCCSTKCLALAQSSVT